MQGRSFRDNLGGHTPANWRKAVYYRYWMHQRHRPAHFGLRTRRHKLIFFYGQPLMHEYGEPPTDPAWEFYDLETDPKERYNRYGEPDYREVIDSLKRELFRLKQELGDSDSSYPAMQSILEKVVPG
ncbi:MAG: DUF4976 domain-containing protein [Balneolaceae bacterium]|nr:DUF4976 domain-containing protein [Balneolaceae bacterium]